MNQPTTMNLAPEPGWYQDPHGPGLRWWDGTAWTDHIHAEAPDPPAASDATSAALLIETAGGVTASPSTEVAGDAPDADALMAMYGARRVSTTDPEGPDFTNYKILIVILGLAIVAIVIGLLLIGGR